MSSSHVTRATGASAPSSFSSSRRVVGLTCQLALNAGYINAGTVEFILDEDRSFYFLEMNTRLQVKHPVTELINSLDLVELQLRITAGEPLPFRQQDVSLKGWAMEVRICAEDTKRGFVPSIGLITRYAAPRCRQVRVDSGVDAVSTVQPPLWTSPRRKWLRLSLSMSSIIIFANSSTLRYIQ